MAPARPRQRKQPQRTCVACREIEGKRQLLRVVRSPEGEVSLDLTGRRSGRGAYVHSSVGCIDKAVRAGGLSRALKAALPPDLQSQLSVYAVPDEQTHTPAGTPAAE